MNLKEIDPIDFAGAVGHAAAAQFYVLLSGDDSQNWPACVMTAKDDSNLAQVVDLMARYVVKRAAGGEQLYTYARLEGMTAFPNMTEPPPGVMACYALFAKTTLQAHGFLQKLITLQDDAERVPQVNVPLKLEDSIFAPDKPLGYIEPHQAAHLAALGMALAVPSIETVVQAFAIGESIATVAGEDKPAVLSIGTIGDQEHAQDTAAAGQEAGDPGADAGEASPAVRTPGAAGSGAADARPEDGVGADAAGETGAPAALPADDGAGEAMVKPPKGKSAN